MKRMPGPSTVPQDSKEWMRPITDLSDPANTPDSLVKQSVALFIKYQLVPNSTGSRTLYGHSIEWVKCHSILQEVWRKVRIDHRLLDR